MAHMLFRTGFLIGRNLKHKPNHFHSYHRSDLIRISHRIMSTSSSKKLSDAEWKKKLSREEYHVLRQKGTEPAGTGEYDSFYPPEGYFACRGCGNPLYTAEAKFKSGCGWPAFDRCVKGSIATHTDVSFGMRRVEIVCAQCGGHQGHVFEGEGFTETNERHCVNSMSVKFHPGPLPDSVKQLGQEKVTNKL